MREIAGEPSILESHVEQLRTRDCGTGLFPRYHSPESSVDAVQMSAGRDTAKKKVKSGLPRLASVSCRHGWARGGDARRDFFADV